MIAIVNDPNVVPSFNGSSLYGNFRTRSFTDIYTTLEDFKEDYNDNGIATTISDDTLTTLYYLLYAKYGNSTIASSDETQFKYKLFSIIFMYGPTWEKRLTIQKEIRELSMSDLALGAQSIYNHAYNPSTEVGLAEDGKTPRVLSYINDQNTQTHKRSIAEAYALLASLLETDVTAEFINRFKDLFIKIVEPELPLWYSTEGDI